jgi:hypothetical protein
MKKLFVVLAVFYVVCAPMLWSQSPVGPLSNDYRTYIWRSGTTYYSPGLVGSGSQLIVGMYGTNLPYRVFCQWTIPDNIIPDGATITQAKLEFDIGQINGPQNNNFWFTRIDQDLSQIDQSQYGTFFEAAGTGPFFQGVLTSNNHYVETYGAGHPMLGWIAAQLPLDRLTLAIGLLADGSPDYSYFIFSFTMRLTVWVAPQEVTADQVFENEARVEGSKVGHWEQSEFLGYDVPYPFSFEINSTETMRADTSVWTNPQTGLQEKYRTWNGLSNVVNHKDFLVLPGLSRVESQFQQTKKVTVQAQLVDGGTIGGTIDFKDPWLIDTADSKGPKNRGIDARWWNRSSPFEILTSDTWYKGVFLNQDYNIPGNPYYSVGAPNPNTFAINLNNYTAYFQNWEGTSVQYQNAGSVQTGVVFTAADATAVAHYKLHLASSLAEAISQSGQRKIIRDFNGHYHAVYSSGDHVWYSQSVDGGTTWIPEKRVDEGTYVEGATQRFPTVTYQTHPSFRIVVVWEEYLEIPGELTISDVYARTINPATYQMDTQVLLGSAWVGPQTFSAMPVVQVEQSPGGNNSVLAVWYDPDLPGLRANVKDGTTGQWSGETILLDGTTITGLTAGPNRNQTLRQPLNIAWVEGNGRTLKYATVRLTGQPLYAEIEAMETVVANTGVITEPTMVNVGPYPGIAWIDDGTDSGEQGSGPLGGGVGSATVRYRERGPEGWDTPITIWEDVYNGVSSPTVTSNVASNTLSVFWRGGNTIHHYKRVGDKWFPQGVVTSGATPSVSVFVPDYSSGLSEVLLSRGGESSPYSVQRSLINYSAEEEEGSPLGPTQDSTVAEGRGGEILFREGSMQIAVVNPTLNGRPISYPALNDTLPALSLAHIEAGTTSKSFNGQGTLELRLMYRGKGTIPAGARVRLVLKDSRTGQVLSTLRTCEANADTIVTLSQQLTYPGKTVLLGLKAEGMASSKRLTAQRWFAEEEQETRPLAGIQSSTEHTPDLPTVFALHQSYPNPFNPTTTIKYDLPEGGNVSLIVYDVLGREVTNLVDGFEEAGYRAVTWNATTVASGVYFARLNVADANGGQRFTAVRKLVLLR